MLSCLVELEIQTGSESGHGAFLPTATQPKRFPTFYMDIELSNGEPATALGRSGCFKNHRLEKSFRD